MREARSSQTHAVPRIDVREPAMCCGTGVCGDDPDAVLISFTADRAAADDRGTPVVRHNVATEPGAFVSNPRTRSALGATGSGALPIVEVDGQAVLTGAYPTRTQLLGMTGIAESSEPPVSDVAPGPPECCGVASGCR